MSDPSFFEPPVTSLLHAKASKMGVPLSVTFELTSRCNFNCRMCYIHSAGKIDASEELSAQQWLDIASQAKELGALYVLITGGEPMLRSDFLLIYKSLCEMGFIVYINSNASLISEEIFKLFESYPPFRINVSLYGGSEETYNSLCATKSFSTVVKNIRRLKKTGIQVYLNNSLTAFNGDDVEQIQRLADELGCKLKTSVYVYPPLRKDPSSVGTNAGRYSPEEAAERKLAYEKLHYTPEVYRERCLGVLESIRRAEKLRNSFTEGCGVLCRAGSSTFWVDWRGNMSACGMIDHGKVSLKENTVAQAWKAVLESTARIRLPLKCRNCRYRLFCNYCAAVCFTETGSFDGVPEYVCRMQQKTEELLKEEFERGTNEA